MVDTNFLKHIRSIQERAEIKERLLSKTKQPVFNSIEEFINYYRSKGYIPVNEYIDEVMSIAHPEYHN